MWLCRMCNHSNSTTVIECIVCKNAKTDTQDNDNNNNADDSNNNKRNSETNCGNNFPSTKTYVLPKLAVANEDPKKLNRRSCSFMTQRTANSLQRLSFSNADDRIVSPGSPKYSYIGISEPLPPIQRPDSSQTDSKWTCNQCLFAENEASSSRCNICEALASECSVITVSKDSVRYTPPKRRLDSESLPSNNYLRQNLDGDFQFLPTNAYDKDEWTCKKCTLVNVEQTAVCVACGGSKIRSLTSTPEATLKHGEFWRCPRCTLKNSLKVAACAICMTPRSEVSTSVKYNTNTGQYTANNTVPKCKGKDHIISSRKKPVQRVTNRKLLNSSGEITELANGTVERKTWTCDECTFENSVESPSCEMCQSSRTICGDVFTFSTDTFSKHLSDNDNTSIVLQTKQQSELMEHLRQNEEQEALIKWQQIVQYCKEVSVSVNFCE